MDPRVKPAGDEGGDAAPWLERSDWGTAPPVADPARFRLVRDHALNGRQGGTRDELGIAPCNDAKTIRRAYAARLKKLDPDREPAAFARLRDAFERALTEAARGADRRSVADSETTTAAAHEDDPAEDGATGGSQTPADDDESAHSPAEDVEPAEDAEPAEDPPEEAFQPNFQTWAPTPDHDEVRDRALLIALDGALRRCDGNEAVELYYRAAATGALSLEGGSEVVAQVLDVAVDDLSLSPAAFRHLARTVGLDTPQSRAPVSANLRQRVLARLAAEDWYDDVVAQAQRKWRKGRPARRRAKLARLLLGRIGRYWHPRVDKDALKSWLDQYHSHKAWLGERIDPAWIRTLEGRLRRREIFWLGCFTLLIGSLLISFAWVTAISVIERSFEGPLWVLLAGPFAAVFLIWLLKLLAAQFLRLSFPGWTESAAVVRLRDWARRIGARWRRMKAK
jgi:hypothetical protein